MNFENDDIMTILQNWTLDAIYNETRTVLEKNGITPTPDLMASLESYRVVRYTSELVKGGTLYYFRLIDDDDMAIHSGIFCKINTKATKDCGEWLVCRNYGFRQFYQICFAQHLVFQKFTRDQQILIESAELLL